MSCTLPAVLTRPLVVRVFDDADELRGAAQRIITAFKRKHGTVRPITREYADGFLRSDGCHGIDSDERAIELRDAIVLQINEDEAREDDRSDCFECRAHEYCACEYIRDAFPPVADECEWLSDEGWQQMIDAAVAAE